jgi:predicted Fe-S protein YdhL (DUF1289 family)
VLDAATGWCKGCFRTIEEIAGWTAYSAQEKRAVIVRVKERRAATSAPAAGRPR